MVEIASRTSLEKALFDYVPPDKEAEAKTFLSGLSLDEMHFVAEFLGSSMVALSAQNLQMWNSNGDVRAQQQDYNHKTLILSEFAACCGFRVKFR